VRYDPDVRTVLVAVALLIAAGTREASSRPARNRDFDLLERDEPIDPCGSGKTWKIIETCLGKQGTTKVLYEAEGVKVVELAYRAPATSTRLSLYSQRDPQRDKSWFRGSLYASGNPSNAMLGVTAFTTPLGVGLRVDMGNTMRTMVSFNDGVTRGVVRRITSTICVPGTWLCRAVMTSCDTYVRGRLVWTFHGSVTWHASLGLRLQGDTTRAGGMCTAPKTMIDDEDRD
jgi:hypothetical protein